MKPDRRAVIAIWTSIAVIACTAVYAAKVYEISFQNEFKTGSVDIKIEQYEKTEQGEKLIDPGVVMPNQDVSYIPRVTNLRSDGYVRVKVELKMDKEITRPLTIDDVYDVGREWLQRGEYFYNTEVMKTNETSDLFEGFHIPDEWTQDKASGFKFSVTADVIQDDNFEPDFDSQAPWGNIEIERAKEEDNIVYGIATEKKNDNLYFRYGSSTGLESEYTDLFAGFDRFMAGDRYKDTLEMQNRSDNDILVYFKTQAVNDDLLEKMRLRIKCGEEKVYDGDLVSAELNEYKALTEVKAGSDGRFDFEVMLPEDSGNYYSVLEDKVIWKFRVEEADKGRGVMTGDGTDIIIIIVLAALSAGGIIYSLTTLKRVKRK